jgi:O-acetylhomoserine/O-acetylserine sulfhydrylase-like pyridoxal-dependent enzyme
MLGVASPLNNEAAKALLALVQRAFSINDRQTIMVHPAATTSRRTPSDRPAA